MIRQLKPIFTRYLSLLFLVSLLVLNACKPKMELETVTQVMDRNLPDEISYNVRILELDGERVDYILEADKIERFHDRRILNGWKVLITNYDAAGNINTTIKADSTIVDDARNIIFANGNVFMQSPNGTISTSRIVWDRNVDEVLAPDQLTLTRNGSVLRGSQLRTDTTISFAELSSVQAEGIFSDEEYIDW